MKLVFLLEESCAKNRLTSLVPRINPTCEAIYIKHEGKTDLRKSIPRKLKAWTEPNVRFVILHDQDGHTDCKKLKAELQDICTQAGRPETVVRIVCRNLESWFLGDLAAVGKAYGKPKLASRQAEAKFRSPDDLDYPTKVLKDIVPDFKKGECAELVAPYLALVGNTSRSFQTFVNKIGEL